MFSIAISAITPIVLLLIIGYYASVKKHFTLSDSNTFNLIVIQYLLPFSLFSSILSIPIKTLLHNLNLFFIIFLSLSIFMMCFTLILHYICFLTPEKTALRSLAYSSAAVPFIGKPILAPFMSNDITTVIIVSAAFAIALVQQPMTFIMLSSQNNKHHVSFMRNLLITLKEPVILAPIMAVILLLVRFPMPYIIIKTGEIMGMAIPAIAMFTSGIILYTQKIAFNFNVILSVIIRNIVTPLIVIFVLKLLHCSYETIHYTALAVSIPVGSVVVIMAIKFNTLQKEMASTLFCSTVLSIVTIPLILSLTKWIV